jgi:hypothetical protein
MQLIINNDGLFILDLSNNIISLQDWMVAVTKIIKNLGGIDGEGYSFGDLISDVIGGVVTIGGFLAKVGVSENSQREDGWVEGEGLGMDVRGSKGFEFVR